MSPLKQRFETELETIMGGLGYKRKKGSLTFTKQISANVSWTVFFQTLPSYPIGETITYIPRVGIRYKDVDLIMRKFSESLQRKKYVLDTISTYLHNVVKECPMHIDYRRNTDSDEFKTFILKMVSDWANPYFEKYSDLDNLIDKFENLGIVSGSAPEIVYLPVLYYVRGYDISRGLNYIARVQRVSSSLREYIFPNYYIEQYKKLYELEKSTELPA